jgi:hypothetical protein
MRRPPYTTLAVMAVGLLALFPIVARIRYGGIGEYLWTASPYALCVALSCVHRLQIGAFFATCAVLVLSLLGYGFFQLKPGEGINGYLVLLVPIYDFLLVIPGAVLITVLVQMLRRRIAANRPPSA